MRYKKARPVQFRVLTPTLKLFETTFWDTLFIIFSLSKSKKKKKKVGVVLDAEKKETPPLFTYFLLLRGGVEVK